MYVNVVERVREAFKTREVVRLDCTHVGTSDCKKIGVKLRVCLIVYRIMINFTVSFFFCRMLRIESVCGVE